MPKKYPQSYGSPITCAETAASALRPAFDRKIMAVQEAFIVIALDTKHRPIGRPYIAALGTVNRVEVAPRDVFREAIKRNAASVIIAHNHPSGELEASDDDKAVTTRMKMAAKHLGIQLLDHVILTETGHLSLAEINLV